MGAAPSSSKLSERRSRAGDDRLPETKTLIPRRTGSTGTCSLWRPDRRASSSSTRCLQFLAESSLRDSLRTMSISSSASSNFSSEDHGLSPPPQEAATVGTPSPRRFGRRAASAVSRPPLEQHNCMAEDVPTQRLLAAPCLAKRHGILKYRQNCSHERGQFAALTPQIYLCTHHSSEATQPVPIGQPQRGIATSDNLAEILRKEDVECRVRESMYNEATWRMYNRIKQSRETMIGPVVHAAPSCVTSEIANATVNLSEEQIRVEGHLCHYDLSRTTNLLSPVSSNTADHHGDSEIFTIDDIGT